MRTPRLALVATPIGNLGDLSPRAAGELREADLWFAEDTRVSAKLAAHLEVRKPMRLVNEYTGPETLARYLGELQAGKWGALVTDGGAPGISDPGAMLCDLAHEAGIEVDALPGPSAPIAALMLSGFFAQRFVFLGFLGRKAGDIRREVEPFADSPYTLVLFESPHRFRATLAVLGEALGERRYAICREITKMHQSVFRARLPILPSEVEVTAKGEFTIVVEGRRKGAP